MNISSLHCPILELILPQAIVSCMWQILSSLKALKTFSSLVVAEQQCSNKGLHRSTTVTFTLFDWKPINSLTIPVEVVRFLSRVSLRKVESTTASEEGSTLSLWSAVQGRPGLSIRHQNLTYQPIVSSKYCGNLMPLLYACMHTHTQTHC